MATATKTRADAPELKSDGIELVRDKCDYCGEALPADGGVAAQGGPLAIRCCCWRHLHWRLVDIFTKGIHAELGIK